MKPILELESARLVLRQWRDDDLPEFAAMSADPQVMRYFPELLSRLESAALIGRIRGHFNEYGFGLWALERKDTGAFIGFTGLNTVSFDAPFTPPWKSAGAWHVAIGAWASPARRRGPACVPRSASWGWTRWCHSPPSATCLRKR